MATAFYWAIPCPHCQHMIAFDLVRFDKEGKPVTPTPKSDLFLAECPNCHLRTSYSSRRLVIFEGPYSRTFRQHPAFRLSHPQKEKDGL